MLQSALKKIAALRCGGLLSRLAYERGRKEGVDVEALLRQAHLTPREIGLLYYVIASAKTLLGSLQRVARYSDVANEGIDLEVKQGEALLPSAWNPTETGRFPHSANGFLWC